jgi:hypothetical protein
MELSWFALAPTIVTALVLAAMVLLQSGDRARIEVPKGDAEATPSGSFPTLDAAVREAGDLLRSARKPVWPIDYNELNTRVRRGLKVAAVMVFLGMMAFADSSNSSDFWLIVFLLSALPLTALGSLISVPHSLILQALPWRGLIPSTLLGVALGAATAYGLRTHGELPQLTLVWVAGIYGFIVGIIDFATPEQRPTKSRRRR